MSDWRRVSDVSADPRRVRSCCLIRYTVSSFNTWQTRSSVDDRLGDTVFHLKFNTVSVAT